jgi:hypothetical protein
MGPERTMVEFRTGDILRADAEALSIALPPLGSGLGGLHWSDARGRIEEAARALPDVSIVVFEPHAAAAAETAAKLATPPKMTTGRAALVGLVHQYLGGLLDPFVTLLEVHKLMYFMQEAGEPLRLRYVKAPYGPYAENLRHVISAIDGYFLSGYGDGGDAPVKELSLVPGAAEEASAILSEHPVAHARFERVADLVAGFETSFGLELLSTVHWVMSRDGARSAGQITDAVYAWAERKRRFTPRHIELASSVLSRHGWASGAKCLTAVNS